MAICQTCKAETSRVRTHWAEDGSQYDECPQCAPGSFEKFTAPSDKKIWPGWSAHPNEYEKQYDKDGVIYVRKPEYIYEQEEKLKQSTEEEKEKQRRAEEHKRRHRRTEPMTEAETIAAIRKASEIAAWLTKSAASGTDVN